MKNLTSTNSNMLRISQHTMKHIPNTIQAHLYEKHSNTLRHIPFKLNNFAWSNILLKLKLLQVTVLKLSKY